MHGLFFACVFHFQVLNELHVDILDYIERSAASKVGGIPGKLALPEASEPMGGSWINELAFRTMWSEFEWENKVNINTSITEALVRRLP